MSKSSICPIERTFSGTTIPGQSRLGGMEMKGFSAFLKAPALLEPHNRIVLWILVGGAAYSSAEMQSVYSKA